MARVLAAALAALLLVPFAARAQEPKPAAPAQPKPAEVDPATAEAIRKAVEKAKEELREEVRAEMQVAQTSAEFMGTVAPGPKLEFLELNGYFRTRGQLFDNLDLGRGPDAAGRFLFPIPLSNLGRDTSGNLVGSGGTLADANMRLRIEPTLNVSEHVRVRGQVDVLDNYVLGSSTSPLFDADRSPYPVPFFGSSRAYASFDPTEDRPTIQPKQVWGEVETPVGLLMFGRMPSEWGRGMLTNAGRGLDDDFGDTVDRISFTLAPLDTPIGKLSLVPILDFDAEGVTYSDPTLGRGLGQPIDAASNDDARTYAVKLVRIDTADEIRRTLDAGKSSFNFGGYYNYRTQRFTYPEWRRIGPAGDFTVSDAAVRRSGYAHVVDVWGRFLTGKWRWELEAAGVYGSIGETFRYVQVEGSDPAQFEAQSIGRVQLRQWGAVLATEYAATPKVKLGGELGFASGDAAPGFGNQPNVTVAGEIIPPPYGSAEGPQYGQPGDNSIRNFRMNPAYNIDIVLWRRILGQVTDAWYLRPSFKWDVFPGVTFDGALIYSQALYAQSTPSAQAVSAAAGDRYTLSDKGNSPLGIELDGRVTVAPGDGFQAWTEVGVLQPLSGFDNPTTGATLNRGWVWNVGLAVKF